MAPRMDFAVEVWLEVSCDKWTFQPESDPTRSLKCLYVIRSQVKAGSD